MTKQKNQFRGHCQMCGREQAVRGVMAHHGYTVDNGYFNGVCSGHDYAPIERERSEADALIASVRLACDADEMFADKLEQNEIDPSGFVYERRERDFRGYWRDIPYFIPYCYGDAYEQKRARDAAVWNLRGKARHGRMFADMLETVCNVYHGKALVEIVKPVAAARIQPGERRHNGQRVLIAQYQDGGRVYWKDENGKGSWMGSRSWRSMPTA